MIPFAPTVHFGMLAGKYGEKTTGMSINMEISSLGLVILSLIAESVLIFGSLTAAIENPALGIFVYAAGKALLARGTTLIDQ